MTALHQSRRTLTCSKKVIVHSQSGCWVHCTCTADHLLMPLCMYMQRPKYMLKCLHPSEIVQNEEKFYGPQSISRCLFLYRSVVWLTGCGSSLLVVATPLPGSGGEHDGRDLLQHVELSWPLPEEQPQASLIGQTDCGRLCCQERFSPCISKGLISQVVLSRILRTLQQYRSKMAGCTVGSITDCATVTADCCRLGRSQHAAVLQKSWWLCCVSLCHSVIICMPGMTCF